MPEVLTEAETVAITLSPLLTLRPLLVAPLTTMSAMCVALPIPGRRAQAHTRPVLWNRRPAEPRTPPNRQS